jgi:hypothetical protein
MRHYITVCSMCEDLFSMQCTVVLVSACLVVDVAPDSLGKPWTNEFLFVAIHKACVRKVAVHLGYGTWI